MRENLTQKQAFLAMTMFLETYFRQTQADDIGGLLGSMALLEDGSTADPAIWHDWQYAVDLISRENKKDSVFYIKSFEQLSNTELYTILKARCDVFVVEQNCPYPELDDIDQQCWHVQGFVGNNLAVYARIIPPDVHTTGKPAIGRVLTVKDFRGQNLGRELTQQAIDFCHAHYPRQPIFISAQTYLLDFYGSLGFVPCGERCLEDGIEHIDMMLE